MRGSLVAVGIAAVLLASPAWADPTSAARPATSSPTTDSAKAVSAKAIGAVVVSSDAKLDPQARALAKSVYRQPSLQPRISESTARVVLGQPAGAKATARDRELADVVEAARRAKSEAIRTRLLLSLAVDVSVRWLLWVEQGKQGAFARVLDVQRRQFRQVMLVPKAGKKADWSDAAAMLAGLTRGVPLPGPRKAGAQKAPVGLILGSGYQPAEGGRPWWKSPLFWTGLGAVVVVGVTVLVLSQTGTTSSDTVLLSGQVPR